MTAFRFHLGKYGTDYKKKFVCPSCGKNTLVPYINSISGEVMPDYGLCDRKNSCGFSCYPESEATNNPVKREDTPPPIRNFVHPDIVKQTMRYYETNTLYNYLITIFGYDQVKKVFNIYCVGTGKYSATIFWYMNIGRKFYNGKKITYKTDGHRNKNFVPFYLFKAAEGYGQCFFGEHLLSFDEDRSMIVNMVESEKSAIIGSICEPKFIWLACGGANGLTEEKIKVLKGRVVNLFPDCDTAGREAYGKKVPIMNKAGINTSLCDLNKSLDDGSDYADLQIKNILDKRLNNK